MMDLRLHVNAAENFNRKAEELLAKIKPLQGEQHTSITEFDPDIVPSGAISEANIIGGITRQSFDNVTGNIKDIAFASIDNGFQIPEEDYGSFRQLVENIQRTSVFRSTLSPDFISRNIIRWLQLRLQHDDVSAFSGFLEEKAMEAVDIHEVWIPIAHLFLEEELSLGSVRFRTIT